MVTVPGTAAPPPAAAQTPDMHVLCWVDEAMGAFRNFFLHFPPKNQAQQANKPPRHTTSPRFFVHHNSFFLVHTAREAHFSILCLVSFTHDQPRRQMCRPRTRPRGDPTRVARPGSPSLPALRRQGLANLPSRSLIYNALCSKSSQASPCPRKAGAHAYRHPHVRFGTLPATRTRLPSSWRAAPLLLFPRTKPNLGFGATKCRPTNRFFCSLGGTA